MEMLFFALPLSVIFYFVWNAIAPIYCYWLPEVYKHLPFWHCVGIFVIIAIVRAMILPWSLISVTKNSWKR